MSKCYFCQAELNYEDNCVECCNLSSLKIVRSFYQYNLIYRCVITDFKVAIHLFFDNKTTKIFQFAGYHICTLSGFPIAPSNFHSKIKTILTFY